MDDRYRGVEISMDLATRTCEIKDSRTLLHINIYTKLYLTPPDQLQEYV